MNPLISFFSIQKGILGVIPRGVVDIFPEVGHRSLLVSEATSGAPSPPFLDRRTSLLGTSKVEDGGLKGFGFCHVESLVLAPQVRPLLAKSPRPNDALEPVRRIGEIRNHRS